MCIRSMCFALATLFIAFAGCGVPEPAPQAGPEATPVAAQKATAGVGKQGQSLNDNEGVAKIISGPAATLFKVKQRLIFDVQIPQALQMFQASEGRMPKDHDEFMTKIVEFNRLQLPELPAGNVYRFNPEAGELWVYPEADLPN